MNERIKPITRYVLAAGLLFGAYASPRPSFAASIPHPTCYPETKTTYLATTPTPAEIAELSLISQTWLRPDFEPGLIKSINAPVSTYQNHFERSTQKIFCRDLTDLRPDTQEKLAINFFDLSAEAENLELTLEDECFNDHSFSCEAEKKQRASARRASSKVRQIAITHKYDIDGKFKGNVFSVTISTPYNNNYEANIQVRKIVKPDLTWFEMQSALPQFKLGLFASFHGRNIVNLGFQPNPAGGSDLTIFTLDNNLTDP